MGKLNKRVLELVREELDLQGLELIDKANKWQIDGDNELRLEFLDIIREVRGVTSILDLTSPTRLLNELSDIVAEAELISEVDRAVIAEAAQVCINYLSFLLQRGVDNILLVLPEINRLREIKKTPVILESDAISHLLPEQLVVNYVSEQPPEVRLIVRRARHMYQQGLLHAIKGSSKQGAFRILGHAVRRIQQAVEQGDESNYWLMILQVLDAFAKRSLSLDKSRLRAFMALERQMRSLMNGSTDLSNAYPQAVQKQMLTLFLLSGLKSEQAKKTAVKLGVEPLPFNEENIKDDRALFGSEGIHSFSDTMSVLKDDLDSMSFFIERLEGNQTFDAMDKENLANKLLSIADVSSVTGFAVSNKRFTEHVEVLGNLDEDEDVPQVLITQMVDSMLYLECLLLEMNNQIPSEETLKNLNETGFEQLVEANIVRHAQRVVLDESKDRLNDVMGKVSELESDYIDVELIEQVQASFAGVAGASQIMGLEKAAAIAGECKRILTEEKMVRLIEAPEAMATLADIVVSLEYYLDNCRWDMNFDLSVLSVADESLESLAAS